MRYEGELLSGEEQVAKFYILQNIKVTHYYNCIIMSTLELENQQLKKELEDLKVELQKTKEHLKKYTAPERNKIYYETHKEEHKKNVKAYLTPERRKEYNKTYYEKKRALKQKESLSNDIKN